MNTNNNLKSAESYYKHMVTRDFGSMAKFLHPKVQLVSPLKEISGKQAVLESAIGLGKMVEKIEIRARFSEGNQIVFIYDFFFPSTVGKLRSSVLMDFKDNMICRIELFFDAQPFSIK